MRPSYAWRCFACSEANKAGACVCAACGFPACATGADIRAAEAVGGATRAPVAVIRPGSDLESIAEALAPLPRWRQVVAVCGAILSMAGCFGLKLTFSLVGVLWSMAGVASGLALMALALGGVEPSASSGRGGSRTHE